MIYRTESGKGKRQTWKAEQWEREDASLLSLTLIQVCLLVLVGVAVKAEQQFLAMVLLGVVLLAVLGRLWAGMTTKHLSISLQASRNHMFPGDQVTLTYRVRNDKGLPVLWVDILQPLATPACLKPVEERDGVRQLRKMSGEEKQIFHVGEEEEGFLFQERCSMVGSYRTVSFDTVWQAERRGLYTLEGARIYTGDGFGITRYRIGFSGSSQKHFVIYPRIVDVNGERFIKHIWEGESGGRGVVEDLSVIRLTRPYENGDAMKRLNWRLLARGQNLIVNQYEVVNPRAIHFIFDGESFRGYPAKGGAEGKKEENAMEDALSVLASLLLRLSEKGMTCGFSFPVSAQAGAVNLFSAGGAGAGEAGLEGEILYQMAAYQPCLPAIVRNPENGKEEKRYAPSIFAEEELLEGNRQIGMYYYVTYDEKSASASSLLEKLTRLDSSVEVLTYGVLATLKEGGTGI